MEEESPLDLLHLQIREAEIERQAAEKELDRTPSWRFRTRAKRRRRFERRLAEKQQLVALAAEVSGGNLDRQSIAAEKGDD